MGTRLPVLDKFISELQAIWAAESENGCRMEHDNPGPPDPARLPAQREAHDQRREERRNVPIAEIQQEQSDPQP